MKISDTVADVRSSFIGPETCIVGDLFAECPIRVEGTVEGDIRGPIVEIGATAIVKGSIHADTVILEGAMVGPMKAATIRIAGQATLDGNLICESLEIAAGAMLNAYCRSSHRKIPAAQSA